MTGIELFILIGGCYALYTVGMAIATHLDNRQAFQRYVRPIVPVLKLAHYNPTLTNYPL